MRGDGVEAGVCDALLDALRTAQAPGLRRLRAPGLSGAEHLSAQGAVQGT